MISSENENLSRGMTAKGSWIAWRILRVLLKSSSALVNAIIILGTIAIERVIKALLTFPTLKLMNPDMTYYPVSVPVRVDDYPAANNPTPQMYLAVIPNVS